MKSFRTLDLAKEYYRLCRNLRLNTHLRDQFLRCSSSVALKDEEIRKIADRLGASLYKLTRSFQQKTNEIPG